jgi:glycosyltransferase involved in cell wall biosynthesis
MPPENILHGLGGRPLRVLHIGNIANNAYYNAKFLRQAGVEADVFCPDNYWVMSSPEWEEADFEGVPADQYHPDWWALDLKGYTRPRWFAQGPVNLCIAYLLARQRGETVKADWLWAQMEKARRAACRPGQRRMPERVNRLARSAQSMVQSCLDKGNDSFHRRPSFQLDYQARSLDLIAEFARRFPERTDPLTMDDLTPYASNVQPLVKLFQHYDIIQAYATDPLYPMLAGFKPYVAFEHGTLRDAPEWEWTYKGPFYNNTIGRLTALSYALAGHVFITNADCLSSAQRLGLTSYEPMPHPLDESVFIPTDAHRQAIRAQVGAETVFFCPIRHDWVDKGVDRYLRALPALKAALGSGFRACFTPWGREIERSKALIAELGCEDIVKWVGPFGAVQFARWLSAADVVWDQVAYPSFSGMTPRALACGTPVIAAFDPAGMAWMFAEPAPVLNARTAEAIAAQTLKALAPGFRQAYRQKARGWIEKYHSSARVTKKLLHAYAAVLEGEKKE